MEALWQDVRYGFRMLGKNPGFTAVVVIVLGIGIGATTIMLSVIDGVVLRACPYKESETLVCVWEMNKEGTAGGATSYAGFHDWQERSHVFARLVGAGQWDCRVQAADRTEKTRVLFVSPGFFAALGAQPILGRTFLPEEESGAGQRVALLSHTHWQHWFGGAPDVVGKTMTVDQQVVTVIGVLPPDFRWAFQTHVACGLWMPMAVAPHQDMDRRSRGLVAIGRLKPGTSPPQAQAEMDVIARQLAQEYPDMAPGIAVVPIHDEVARRAMQKGTSRTLLLLLGIAVSVLLIACLHVASLLVARAATREQEIAVRAALGAHRLRLVRQMLTESVLLAAAAGLLGVLLAYWGLQIFGALRGRTIPWFLGPGSYGVIPWFVHVRMDGRVLLYAAGVSLLTCSFFGVLPALGATALNLSRSLSAGRTRTAGPRFQRLRGLLVIGDIALAFILLLGAGLLLNSFARILAIDFGYNPQDVVSVSVPLYDLPAYSQPQAEAAFIQEVVRRVQRLPGVRTVAIGSSPVRGTGNIGAFKIEGVFSEEKRYRYPDWDARLPDKSYLWLPLWWVSPEYFRILQIPLLKGRCFTEQDGAGSPPVAIVSEALARRFWPNGSPIGKYLTQAPQDSKSAPIPREIVGVVATLTHLGRSEPADQEVYAPASQFGEVDFLIRTDPGRKDVAAAVRREILALDRDVIIGTMAPLEEEIADFFAPQRFVLLCVGGFAVVALVLACLGVYGTTAYAVSQRTHEIGIRVALGARSRDILRAVLGQGLRFTLAGLALGCAGALVATRIIRSFLYEVSPTDPLTFACVALVLAGVALLASYLPARRAAKTDPMTALRYE